MPTCMKLLIKNVEIGKRPSPLDGGSVSDLPSSGFVPAGCITITGIPTTLVDQRKMIIDIC